MNTPLLTYSDLMVGFVLVAVNAGLSFLLNLGVGRSLLVAALRATAQLLLVGLILKYVFASSNPWLVLAVAMVMVLLAANEVRSRQKKRFAGVWGVGVGACATMVSTVIVLTCAVIFIVEGEPWWAPQLIVPLVGIVLGSVMNGVGISLNVFNTGLERERNAIEAQLALGATGRQALKPLQRNALRSGFIPIVNQMSAAGVITLPGMMTGQILAGMEPYEAAKYQILVLFLLAAAAGFGALVATTLALHRATDERDRLRLDRLSREGS
ncbi:MAG TPA: iron export ABC transporter permease subunit FetB [Burkholderiaceae bacterium]|nr:iron export ABC transporter permease subunit FetB [Burkholderiaceae bacterium]